MPTFECTLLDVWENIAIAKISAQSFAAVPIACRPLVNASSHTELRPEECPLMIDREVTTLSRGSLQGVDLRQVLHRRDTYQVKASFEPSLLHWVASEMQANRPGNDRAEFVVHAIVTEVRADGVMLYNRLFNLDIFAPAGVEKGLTLEPHRCVVVRTQQSTGDVLAAVALSPLPLHEASGVLATVRKEDSVIHSVILYQFVGASEQHPFRYIVVPNGTVYSGGIPMEDWYGRPVAFTACVDQPTGSGEFTDGSIYKAISVTIFADEPRTDVFEYPGVLPYGSRGNAEVRRAISPMLHEPTMSILQEWRKVQLGSRADPSAAELEERRRRAEVSGMSEDLSSICHDFAQAVKVSAQANEASSSTATAAASTPTKLAVFHGQMQATMTTTTGSFLVPSSVADEEEQLRLALEMSRDSANQEMEARRKRAEEEQLVSGAMVASAEGTKQTLQMTTTARTAQAPQPPGYGLTNSEVVQQSTVELLDDDEEEEEETPVKVADGGEPAERRDFAASTTFGYQRNAAMMASAAAAEKQSRLVAVDVDGNEAAITPPTAAVVRSNAGPFARPTPIVTPLQPARGDAAHSANGPREQQDGCAILRDEDLQFFESLASSAPPTRNAGAFDMLKDLNWNLGGGATASAGSSMSAVRQNDSASGGGMTMSVGGGGGGRSMQVKSTQ